MQPAPDATSAQKSGPTPALWFSEGLSAGNRILLEREITTVGRSETNDLVLTDARVSRVHAEIRKEAFTLILADLGSGSGTSHNGELLTGPTVIHHGDEIGFGPFIGRLDDPASADAADTTLEFALEDAGRRRPSSRQLEVLGLVAQGLTHAEVGEKLGISERTVKAYAQELYVRLGVHSRAEAVARGVRLGLI